MNGSRNSFFKERIKHILKNVKDIKGKLSEEHANQHTVPESKPTNS